MSFDLPPLHSLSPEMARAARWLEAHGREAALYSMRECARRAGLTPATFTRLAQRCGFDGFDALRQHLRQQWLQTEGDDAPHNSYTARASALQQSAGHGGDDWLHALSASQHANAASALALNTPAQLRQAAKRLHAAKQVFFLGLRAAHGLAFHMAYLHGLLASNGHLVQDTGGARDDQLARLRPQDLLVVISLSPYAQGSVQAAQRAVDHGVPVLALTDSRLSPLAQLASQSLLVQAEGGSFFPSMVGALALSEVLLAAFAVQAGAQALNCLQERQHLLAEQGAYWTPPRRSAGQRSANGPPAGAPPAVQTPPHTTAGRKPA